MSNFRNYGHYLQKGLGKTYGWVKKWEEGLEIREVKNHGIEKSGLNRPANIGSIEP